MPFIRALNVRRALTDVGVLTPAQQAAIFAAVRPETIRAIQAAQDMAWLDITLSAELNNAIFAVMSQPEYRRWSRAMALHVIKRSMVSGMVEAALRLFDVTPQGLFKMMPRGWGATYKDAGVVTVAAVPPLSTRFAFVDLPAPMRTSQYLETIAGGMETVFDMCHVDGKIVIERGSGVDMVATWVAARI